MQSVSESTPYANNIERLHFALQAAGIGIWEVDLKTNKVIWDDSCRALFGLVKGSELPYEKAIEFIHKDDVDRVNNQVQAALKGENNGAYNATYRTIGATDGILRWVNFTGTAYFDEVGHVVRFGGVAQDVSAVHDAHQRIVNFQQQIISLLDQSEIGIAINLRGDLAFSTVNTAYARLVGRTPEEIVGKSLADALPEISGHGFDNLLNSVMNTGVPYFAREAAIALRKGEAMTTVYVNFAYQPLYDESGTANSTLTIVTDETDQVIARKAIEASELHFRSLIQETPVATCLLIGPELKIEVINNAMLDTLGLGPSVTGKRFSEIMPDKDFESLREIIAEVFNSGNARSLYAEPLHRNINSTSSCLYFNCTFKPLRDANGLVYGVLTLWAEVTKEIEARLKIEEIVAGRTLELKTVNDSLQAANFELKRSNRNLEDFAHAASHDLKEPIRKIQIFTSRLQGMLPGDMSEEFTPAFDRILNSARRMGQLVDNLLQYAHVNHRPIEKEVIDLDYLVNEVLDNLEHEIYSAGATLKVAKLPEIRGYRQQIYQLFQNLLSNALKYRRSDAQAIISISASIEKKSDQQYHCLAVSDNGTGFDQRYAEKIFEMFTRLPSGSQIEGTGVGLAIVKRITENHDGIIEAEAKKEHGAVFKVYLPFEASN